MNQSESLIDLSLIQDFIKFTGCALRSPALSNAVTASRETTFRIGGVFDYFFEPDSPEQIADSIKWMHINKQPLRFLGFGSNLLVSSSGVRSWVLRLGRGLSKTAFVADNIFRVDAGVSLSNFAREVSRQGYSGLEFAAGIPGSVGGAVRMNAGAHKSEISDILHSVQGYSQQGQYLEFNVSDLTFDYRHCSLPQDFLITSAGFRLVESNADSIMRQLTKNLEYRKSTQPLSLPSAGSVFRNPSVDLSAGALIESLGLKGFTKGKAQISSLHANWIVNPQKEADSKDVLELIEICQKLALEKKSVRLQPEVVVW